MPEAFVCINASAPVRLRKFLRSLKLVGECERRSEFTVFTILLRG